MAENLTLIDAEKIPAGQDSWEKLSTSIITSCQKLKKDREKEILIARFGIGAAAKTLNAIGLDYGITRERVRQIINNALKKIQKNNAVPAAKKKVAEIEKVVEEKGGFTSFDELCNAFKLTEKSEKNSLKFVACLSTKLNLTKESNVLRLGFATEKVKMAQIKKIVKETTNLLKEVGEVQTLEAIAQKVKADPTFLESVLFAAKGLMKTDDGKWGMTKWPHVNPKSIRDKSKYIMIRYGEPLHYVELTKKISEMGDKNVTQQSVHNELIKNIDFVLVGRGIYALREWGYNPGVVEEVIVEILAEAGQPLHKNEIIDKVLEKRIVKASTVILNLQKNRFKRVGKAVYTLN